MKVCNSYKNNIFILYAKGQYWTIHKVFTAPIMAQKTDAHVAILGDLQW